MGYGEVIEDLAQEKAAVRIIRVEHGFIVVEHEKWNSPARVYAFETFAALAEWLQNYFAELKVE